MRYAIILSYEGTRYFGWQKQPGEITVQQVVEDALSTLTRNPTEVVGCGRTDTGVHAKYYVAHFEAEQLDPGKLRYQLNAITPSSIAIKQIVEVPLEFHARFDAFERQYTYRVHFEKDPFLLNRSYYLHLNTELDYSSMHEAASVILQSQEFLPFCKTGSDAKNFRCQIFKSEWTFSNHEGYYTIRANRFLRGMVRMIVGATINIGLGKLSLEELRNGLVQQRPLSMPWSVPPEGLYLDDVKYPDEIKLFPIRQGII